ncbi:MAG: hypothetical protein K2P84_12325, partial [Undibacterium sp.]|nr:hypothetical protein [Undibacterium sp.]
MRKIEMSKMENSEIRNTAGVSRRGFLVASGGAAVAMTSLLSTGAVTTGLPSSEAVVACAKGIPSVNQRCLRELALEDFSHLVGQQFTVTYSQGEHG